MAILSFALRYLAAATLILVLMAIGAAWETGVKRETHSAFVIRD